MDQLLISCQNIFESTVWNVITHAPQSILLTGVNYRATFMALNHEVINKYKKQQRKKYCTHCLMLLIITTVFICSVTNINRKIGLGAVVYTIQRTIRDSLLACAVLPFPVLHFQWSDFIQVTSGPLMYSDWCSAFFFWILKHKGCYRDHKCHFNKLLSLNLTLTAALCHKIHLLPLWLFARLIS